jgi:hypothetical protein
MLLKISSLEKCRQLGVVEKKGSFLGRKLAKSLKIHVEEMSDFCLSTMFMKTHQL